MILFDKRRCADVRFNIWNHRSVIKTFLCVLIAFSIIGLCLHSHFQQNEKSLWSTQPSDAPSFDFVPGKACNANDNFLNWFSTQNISKIAILADSQGPRWTNALIKGIMTENDTVRKIKHENGSRLVDESYFGNDPHILSHTRECSGCQSMLQRISNQMDVEYLSQEFVMDTEIQRFATHWNGNLLHCDSSNCINEIAYTTQEYYFKFHFPEQGYPDIILRFATHMHDAGRFTETEFRRNFAYFLQLMLDYTPKTTKILWFTGMPFANGQDTEKLALFNKISIEQIEEFGAGRIVVAPFDLWAIKTELNQTFGDLWRADNAHMNQPFYDSVMKNILIWLKCNL